MIRTGMGAKSMGWVDDEDNVITYPAERAARTSPTESNGCGTKVVLAVGAAALVIGLVIWNTHCMHFLIISLKICAATK